MVGGFNGSNRLRPAVRRGNVHRYSAVDGVRVHPGSVDRREWNRRDQYETQRRHRQQHTAGPFCRLSAQGPWDNHDAIVFLQRSATYLPSTQQADRFFFSGVHLVGGVSDDYYSLGSRGNKLWLPAEASTGSPSQPNGDQQRFLIDVPLTTGTAPTITLGELKTRIAAVTARLDAGDGSEQYRE